jgi:uroporphyrinogen-III decarboxylase
VPATPYTGPRLTLESKEAVDAYFDADGTTVDAILASGTFEHMKQLADAFGDRVFIAINDGMNGLPGVPYEESVVAAFETPELVAHAIRRQCENFMPRVLAAKACGAHAYIISEGFGGSLGQLSPALEERVQAEGKRWLYAEIRKAGLLPLGYWLGDVRPHMGWLNSLNMAGLLIEEDKKGFALDPLEIRRMLRPETCLFGNLDSNLLLWGTPEAIRAEVRRQRRAAAEGACVIANGSPLVLGTPAANLDAYMDEARK